MIRTPLLLLAIAALAGSLYAQSYTVSSGTLPTTYTDLSAPTSMNLSTGQLSAAIAPTGFSFDYFGATYTNFKVGSGGYIIMGGSGATVSKFPAHGTAPGLVLSPLWDYLAPGSSLFPPLSSSPLPAGTVNYEYVSGVLSVEWFNVPRVGSSSIGVRMKVVLDTASGEIEFHYGSLPNGCTGTTSTYANACAISGPTGTSQEIIPGSMAGYISNSGAVSTYPTGRYVRFAPVANTPPLIVVSHGSSLLPDNSTINVDYNDTLSGLNIQITASDTDGDPVSVAAGITNIGATGIVQTQWESAAATGPYTLTPSSGVFNTVAGVTHVITLTATDGVDQTVYTLNITQAAQSAGNTAPTIIAEYDDNFGTPTNMVQIGNGGTVNVDYGQSVAGCSFSIAIDDADSDPCSVVTTITNLNGTGIVTTEWQSASAGVPYTITPTTGDFNTVAGATHDVTVTVNDGTDDTVLSFSIVQAAQPATPSISVSDGATITAGQAAAGTNRDFGDLEVGTGPSAALTITITNNGSGMLDLSNFAVTGDAGEFVVNTGWLIPGIGGGATTSFTVEFDPTSTGAKSATISFNHNDPGVANPFTFEITGNGTTSTPGPGPTPGTGGGSGGGGGCVAGSGANFTLLLLIAMSACLGARTLRRRVSR